MTTLSSNRQAYKTVLPGVLAVWDEYRQDVERVRTARAALSEAVGRGLMVNRLGFGHGTRVVGFERFDGDQDGDLLHHGGSLIVSSQRGSNHGLIVPNLRRKAGKEFAEELRQYDSPRPSLQGMPEFHIGGVDGSSGAGFGLAFYAPALHKLEKTLWAYWECDVSEEINKREDGGWVSAPLSEYYASVETLKEQS